MSADEINVDVDELTERFVRGDQARHTEGSGLQDLRLQKALLNFKMEH